ncbi:MAG: isoquinoline 1-oxidoreductase alpha subunit [Cryomorphaceae bacterium]|jgi:isoquinoline 1-oxidoreductase alpha subunit
MKLTINDQQYDVDADPNMPILYVLRDLVGLTATKFGCGVGQCGACTMHLDGNPIRSCLTPVSVAAGKNLTTLEGLAEGDDLHPIQQAWLDHKVAQCGYCQSGQMMSAVALLKRNKNPNEQEIEQSMQGNICRCGTYPRIKAAIKQAGQVIREEV